LAEIVYMPWKQIIVHEVSEMDVPDFLLMVVSGFEAQKQVGDPAVQWADEVAFLISFLPDTPEVVQEKMKGVIHYGFVQFTKTSYQEQKKVTFGGRDRVVKLVKADKNPDFVNLCKFLNGFKGRDAAMSVQFTPKTM
jgi:hypothetical protein